MFSMLKTILGVDITHLFSGEKIASNIWAAKSNNNAIIVNYGGIVIHFI